MEWEMSRKGTGEGGGRKMIKSVDKHEYEHIAKVVLGIYPIKVLFNIHAQCTHM